MSQVVSVPGGAHREPNDRGAVAVEFALVVPLFIVLLFTIVLSGSVYLDQLHLQSAAREGARAGSVDSSSACSAALADLSGNDVGTVQCSVLKSCTTGAVQVQLVAHQTVTIPIVGNRSVTLRASSSFTCSP
jgi:Flp pilus assembly protein TadG